MPYSILTYPGDGVTTTWPINFTLGFISRDDVKCRVGAEVDGLNQPVYRTLTWISDGLVEVQGTPAAVGQNVEFTRTIAKDELVHDYQDGAPITESNLDDSNKQLIMLLHEILDDRLRVLPAANWDMNAKRIVNLGAGIDPTDAVTVQQAAQAIALTPTAVQAAADAAQALADAEDARTDAEAAASAAEAVLAGTLLKSQNLNDVADKAAARMNLDVYSKSETYPTQAGQGGKFLTTDGTTTNWAAVSSYALPTQTGNSGKFLTTSGTTPSWGEVNIGRTDGTEPSSGKVGECKVSETVVGSAVSLSTGVARSVASLSLSPGDWEVFGCCCTNPEGSTITTDFQVCINTSVSIGSAPNSGAHGRVAGSTTGTNLVLSVGPRRFNITSTTTVHLVAQANFTASTNSAFGIIKARRMS